MSPHERITTLEGLGSAATVIDPDHNLRANPYRLVSSDGVLFTVSADTLRHVHVLWDMAQSATGTLNEVVLSDKDFEHANSVRLLLDLLVYGVVGRKISRKSYPLDHIPDVVDLTLKYDCRCGYEHCISYIDLAFSRSPPTHFLRACEMFVLGGQLDEIRVATTVVRALAELQVKYNNPQYMGWEMRDAALVPPEYLWALSHALYPNLRSPPSFPSPDDAVQVFEDLLATFKVDRPTAKRRRAAGRRAQKPWPEVPVKQATDLAQFRGHKRG